jgi:2'-hydroxyisoflavone reductase
MNILIIGGTRFLGRHIAEAALAAGHKLTLFHRGKTNPELFPEAEHIHGDREADLAKLEDRHWDAVIDTCGYFPRIVRFSCEALKNATDAYLFISSISVYSDLSQPPTEETEVGTIEDETLEEITPDSYGPLKVLCEKVVKEFFDDRALIVRPGLIVGPHDPSDRFTYWPVRMARGGKVLSPDCKDLPVQIIDVRDLAEWIVSAIESGARGTFNATGPDSPYSVGDFLMRICEATGNGAELVWVDPAILDKNEVTPWADMPAILPYDGSVSNMARADISRALVTGLTFRSLEQTAKDTLAYWKSMGEPELKAGLAAEKEAAVLEESLTPK